MDPSGLLRTFVFSWNNDSQRHSCSVALKCFRRQSYSSLIRLSTRCLWRGESNIEGRRRVPYRDVMLGPRA
jgi:hypothetical protein